MDHERVRLAISARATNAAYVDIDAAATALNEAIAHYTSLRVATAAAPVVGLGDFLCHLLRNTVRYVKSGRRRTFFLFNGATYDRMTLEHVELRAARDLLDIASSLGAWLIRHDRLVKRAIKQLRAMILDQDPEETARLMDRGAYIGLNNGVFDIRNDRFLERGSVPPSIMVSMRTGYDYVRPGDPASPAAAHRAQIEDFYRKIHGDPNDPTDKSLATMWLFVGSLLLRARKRPCLFLGTWCGFNGKAKFTGLILDTLGEYGTSVHFAARLGNGLVCTSNECPRRFGDYGTLQAIFHSNSELSAGSHRRRGPFIARFGSTFVDHGAEDAQRRVFQRAWYDHETMKQWAPVHFSMMTEATRDFRTKRRQKREASLMLYAIRVVLLLQARVSRVNGRAEGRANATERANAAEGHADAGQEPQPSPLALCFLRVPHVILMAMARRAVTQLREAAYPKELDFEWDSDQE